MFVVADHGRGPTALYTVEHVYCEGCADACPSSYSTPGSLLLPWGEFGVDDLPEAALRREFAIHMKYLEGIES